MGRKKGLESKKNKEKRKKRWSRKIKGLKKGNELKSSNLEEEILKKEVTLESLTKVAFFIKNNGSDHRFYEDVTRSIHSSLLDLRELRIQKSELGGDPIIKI